MENFSKSEGRWDLKYSCEFGVGLVIVLSGKSKEKKEFWLRIILSEEKRNEELDLEEFVRESKREKVSWIQNNLSE